MKKDEWTEEMETHYLNVIDVARTGICFFTVKH